MDVTSFNREQVIGIVRRNVSSLPIYRDYQRVESSVLPGERTVWACYEPVSRFGREEISTGFHLNFEGDVCYLDYICLAESLRGNGIGALMYEAIERIAREMGCKRVIQTPSGFTKTGETRRDYVKRKFGYRDSPDGISAVKVLD